MPVSNFTPVFNNTLDLVHINITYSVANQPPLMTTPNIFILTLLLGIGCLILSALTKSDMCNDLLGILATPFLLLSAIQAFAVDTVTGVGMASSCVQGVSGSCTITEWSLIENHIIYHYDLLGVVLAIIFLVSLANLYRLWLDYRKITEQEHIGKGPQALDMADDSTENTFDDHRGYAEESRNTNENRRRPGRNNQIR